MTYGHRDNETTQTLSNKIYRANRRGPTYKTNLLWQQEFKSSGAEFRMTYQEFRNKKLRIWHKEKRIKAQKKLLKSTTFIKGRYIGQLVKYVVETNPTYCLHIIDNYPKSIEAKQIIHYFNKQ